VKPKYLKDCSFSSCFWPIIIFTRNGCLEMHVQKFLLKMTDNITLCSLAHFKCGTPCTHIFLTHVCASTMHAENFNVAICEKNAEFLNVKPGGTRSNHRKGLMQSCNTGCKWYVVILVVSRIKHENRGTWPPHYTSIFFKYKRNKCSNYEPDKQWGSVNVSWGHRTSGTTMAKVPWLGESLAATPTTCLAGLRHQLSRFFGEDKIIDRLRATFLQTGYTNTNDTQEPAVPLHGHTTVSWLSAFCIPSLSTIN
jgi:hypothetical protein